MEYNLGPIVTKKVAKILVNDGFKKCDFHAHTSSSYDVLSRRRFSPKVNYLRARKRGMHYVPITDHDTMDGVNQIIGLEGVISGCEFTLYDKKEVGHTIHVNVYELSKKLFTELKKISAEGKISYECNLFQFLDLMRKENLPHIYNHLFYPENNEIININSVRSVAAEFPVLEYNMGLPEIYNKMVLDLAEKLGKGLVATSDSHGREIGLAYTLSKGNTFREYFKNISLGNSVIVPRDLSPKAIQRTINDLIKGVYGAKNRGESVEEFLGYIGSNSDSSFFNNLLKSIATSETTGTTLKNLLLRLNKFELPSKIIYYSRTGLKIK